MAKVCNARPGSREDTNVKFGSGNGGFTLLELLTTLSIASLIVTLGVPSFRSVLENQRMTGATNEMVTALNLAKSEAIKRVAYVSVCKSSDMASCGGGGTDWKDGFIVFANATSVNLGSIDAGDTIIRVYPGLHDSIDVAPSGTVDGFVSFRPSGTMGTTGGQYERHAHALRSTWSQRRSRNPAGAIRPLAGLP